MSTWEPPRCRKNRKQCKIDRFFLENRDTFLSLAKHIQAYVDSLSDDEKTNAKQLRGFLEVIKIAEKDPTDLLVYKNCKRLADVLIAMDSESFKSFFTQNYKESDVLCDFYGQIEYILSNDVDKNIDMHDFHKAEQISNVEAETDLNGI